MLCVYTDPKYRPPVLDEMMPDLQRVIASTAHKYADPSSPHLNFDDLMGAGNLKLAEILDNGHIEKQPSRLNFFKYFAAAVNNDARSRVVKYNFTEKRTGVKPPPKEDQFSESTEEKKYLPRKCPEVSLDDPDTNLQVAAVDGCSGEFVKDIDWGFNSEADEYAFLLTKQEKLVYHELINPSEHARCYAEDDALLKAKGERSGIKIKIKQVHMAQAIGITVKLFEESVLSICRKIKMYRMETNEERDVNARRSAMLSQIKEALGLHIPPDLDDCIVRRMLTMAARDQYENLTPQLLDMLTEVGAKVPRVIGGGKLSCYGVLYQKNCRQCNICGLRQSCSVEAASMGLTKLTISPTLLRANQTRTPAFFPHQVEDVTDFEINLNSNDESVIIQHLKETYQERTEKGLTYYFHHTGDGVKRRDLFCLEKESPIKIRFCAPGEDLESKLVEEDKQFYPKSDASLAEIISLIEQHGKETYA